MASKSVSQPTCNLSDTQLEVIAKWVSCNGEIWGVGPTAVFASAAALFLYNELEATIFVVGDHFNVTVLEKTLVSTMVLGMLALMVHLWVCSTRFFQYYLDTLIRDSPNMLLEMTTAGLLGGQSEMVPLGPLTRFLRQQQPQIHITICWFLSLCYADYVRKHYCQRFNMPYLEQWQAELHERTARGARRTMNRLHSFVGSVHRRLRGFTAEASHNLEPHTETATPKGSEMEVQAARCGVPWSELEGRGGGTTESCCKKQYDALKGGELCVRLLSQSSETTVDAIEKLRNYIQLAEWAKCGEHAVSITPTVLWGVGAAALAQRLISALFRRFLFRRVPLWEHVLQVQYQPHCSQNLLFIWMVIYSLHFWTVLVKCIKICIEYCYKDAFPSYQQQRLPEDVQSEKLMQQWMIWMFGVMPLAIYIHTRPRPEPLPLMIWITTSPWQRREMGPYGYYLNRPLSSLQSSTTLPGRQQAKNLRKAFSDSNILIKEPPKRKRHSKSV